MSAPDSVVERVAEAIRRVNETTAGLTFRELTVEMARAAIEAMREPTDGMVDALMNGAFDAYRGDVVEAYQAAIDAALSEKP